MSPLVITEIYLAARLFRSGILKYFNNKELNFYITDFCYNHRVLGLNNDRAMAKAMIEQGTLKIADLTSVQMERVIDLHQAHKPKFVLKTISAFVYAEDNGFKLISEDELVRDVAGQLNIKAYDKEWLITTLVNEISTMGINIDLELVKEII